MSETSPSNRAKELSIIGSKAQKPFIFFGVMLLAIVFLVLLVNLKLDFDKRENAPLLIVQKPTLTPTISPTLTQTPKLTPTPCSTATPTSCSTATPTPTPTLILRAAATATSAPTILSCVKAVADADRMKNFDYVSVACEEELSNKIFNVSSTPSDYKGKKAKEIINESLNDVAEIGFKNSNELVSSLLDSISERKESAFKNDQKQINKLDEEESRITVDKNRALTDLGRLDDESGGNAGWLCETIISADRVKCADSSKSFDAKLGDKLAEETRKAKEKQAKQNMRNILANNLELNNALIFARGKQILGSRPYDGKDSIGTDIEQYFDAKINSVEDTKEQLEKNINAEQDQLQKYTRNIYKIFKTDNLFALYVGGVQQNPEKKEGKSFSDPTSDWQKVFLSQKSIFSVVYQLAYFTLIAILVFGLIYLILIIINKIFFMSAFAGSLGDQGKNFLQAKDSSAPAEGLARTLVAALAATGVGMAAILAAPSTNPFGKSDRFYADDLPVFVSRDLTVNDSTNKNPNPLKPQTIKNEVAVTCEVSKGDFSGFFENITSLNYRLGLLESEVKNLPRSVNGGSGGDPDIMALVRNISNQSDNINTQSGNIDRSLTSMQRSIGSTNNANNTNNTNNTSNTNNTQNIVQSLNKISTDLSNGIKVSISPTPISVTATIPDESRLLNALKPLNDLSAISRDVSKIAGNTSNIVNETAKANETILDLINGNGGGDGRNFVTKFKNFFGSERYLITPSSYKILESIIPRNNDSAFLLDGIKALSDNKTAGILSDDKLLEAIKRSANLSKEADIKIYETELKKWKRIILRVARIGN